MYTNIDECYGYKLKKKKKTIWEIANDKGSISMVEKDCFVTDNILYKGFFFVKKEKGEYNYETGYNGFTKDTFCKNLDLRIDKSFHPHFRHFNKNKLRESWNKQVDALKISNEILVYEYNMTINNFSQLLEFIVKNVSPSFDKICVRARKDNISLNIYIDGEINYSKIEFFTDADEAPNFTPFASEWDWDDGLDGCISLKKLDEYFESFGGIDLSRSYVSYSKVKTKEELDELNTSFNKAKSDVERDFLKLDAFFSGSMYNTINSYFLPLLENMSDKYIYELIGNKIFAYEILKEDENNWYTIVGEFVKKDIKNIPQFNPNNFSDLYANNFEDLINAFNENLKKFYVY